MLVLGDGMAVFTSKIYIAMVVKGHASWIRRTREAVYISSFWTEDAYGIAFNTANIAITILVNSYTSG